MQLLEPVPGIKICSNQRLYLNETENNENDTLIENNTHGTLGLGFNKEPASRLIAN